MFNISCSKLNDYNLDKISIDINSKILSSASQNSSNHISKSSTSYISKSNDNTFDDTNIPEIISCAQLKTLFENADTNKDRQLDFEEFQHFLKISKDILSKIDGIGILTIEEAKDLFSKLDKTNQG